MATLKGTKRKVNLGDGVSIRALGLKGTATLRRRGEEGLEAAQKVDMGQALEQAFANTHVQLDKSIQIESSVEESVFELSEDIKVEVDVPPPPKKFAQAILAVDEHGAMSWHFPETGLESLVPQKSKAKGGKKKVSASKATNRYVIPLRKFPQGDAEGIGEVFAAIGQTILNVLIYPITDPIVGAISNAFARNWEEQNRAYRVRWMTPDNYTSAQVPSFAQEDWSKLAAGPALMYLHGTFARSDLAFNLPVPVFKELFDAYAGRVVGFDHFTLSESPEQNIQRLIQTIPAGVKLELDVICHSRGGLVGRVLAGALNTAGLERIKMRKVVFVATPNHGTALTDPEHVVGLLDRVTSVLNLIPPGPHSVITAILEAVITVVKVIGHGALKGLAGLASMQPNGEFLKRLNQGPQPTATFFGLTANFDPEEGLEALVRNGLMDVVFGEAGNDLVVPTDGVVKGGGTGFPIAGMNVREFEIKERINHFNFFENPKAIAAIKKWLVEGAASESTRGLKKRKRR